MRIRAMVVVFAFLGCAGAAHASAISYVINFSGGGPPVISIGPGTFSYDSAGQTNTTVGPPVTLTNYSVPATVSQLAVLGSSITFTQTSPSNDSLHINSNGLVDALSVDSTNGTYTLQMNLDDTWSVISNVTLATQTGTVSAQGTGNYTITQAGTPEPAVWGTVIAGLIGLIVLRRLRAGTAS